MLKVKGDKQRKKRKQKRRKIIESLKTLSPREHLPESHIPEDIIEENGKVIKLVDNRFGCKIHSQYIMH